MKSNKLKKIYENNFDKCIFIDYLRKNIYFFDFNDYDYDSYELFNYRFNEMKLDNFCKNKIIENSRFILKNKLEEKLKNNNKKEKRSKI